MVEFEEMLGKFVSSGKTFCNVPSVLPKEGELYIFDLGTDIIITVGKSKKKYSDISK